MSATANPRLTRRIPLLAMVAIVMSLLGPMLTLAAPPPEDPPPSATQCPDGMTWNDETEDCEPPPDIPTVDRNEPFDCPDGQVDQQGACVPDPNQQPPGCEAGQTVDEQGNCVPDTEQFPNCEPGMMPDQQGNCVPDPNESVDPTVAPPVEATTEPSVPAGDDPPAPAGTGKVNVHYHICPPGFDVSTAGLEDFGPCTGQQDGVAFELSRGGMVLDTQVTGSDGPSTLSFADVPPGELLLRQVSPPPGEMAAICGINSPSGNTRPYDFALNAAGAWSFNLEAEEIANCNWYVAETGAVTVNKWECPVAFDIAAATIEDLATYCLTPMDDVWFTLTGAVGPSALQTAGGSLTFHNVPEGTHTLLESVPAGYFELTVAVCRVNDGEPVRYEALGGELELPDFGGSGDFVVVFTCDWYNLLLGENERSRISIEKYNCPPGTSEESSRDELMTTCTEPGAGIEFSVAFERRIRTHTTDAAGRINFSSVPRGSFTIQESMPPGYETTVWACHYRGFNDGGDIPVEGELPLTIAPDGAFTYPNEFEGYTFSCLVYNIPGEPNDNTVTVTKYVCPPGVNPETDILTDVCVRGGDGIRFEFFDGNGIRLSAVTGGTIAWSGVLTDAEGKLQIVEEIPVGYGDPLVNCDGGRIASTDGVVVLTPDAERPFHIECDWFNLAENTSDLIVVKHTCPEGYDPEATSADPATDCPTLTDGVVFHLEGVATVKHAMTGEAGPGTARFDDLAPGEYVVTEAIPEGTARVFVSECFGNSVGSVRPFPLATGGTLDLTVHAGEEITCHWFNVPETEGGTLTVIKYICTGEAFVAEVDCQIYEDGQDFDLLVWDGSAYVPFDAGTTDPAGVLTWTNLAPGTYLLDEPDGEWCHIQPGIVPEPEINGVIVNAGEENVVKVYNCGGEPGTPGDTPTKYPNTGVPPTEGEGLVLSTSPEAPASLPFAALGGLLALTMTRRRLAALVVPAGAAVVTGTALAQDDQVIEPADGTPNGGPAATPTSLCLAGEGETCVRGPVPAQLRIATIGVDAPIEILETVQGVMQQPSDEVHVAWYKETARLGEVGNLLLAGHVNWWGIPEAVFFHLGELQEGDEVILTDAEETAYTYAVEWVRQESNLQPPREEVLGMTGYEAVTLMTCSGEWNAAISEYDARTVVRAELVDVQPTRTASEIGRTS